MSRYITFVRPWGHTVEVLTEEEFYNKGAWSYVDDADFFWHDTSSADEAIRRHELYEREADTVLPSAVLESTWALWPFVSLGLGVALACVLAAFLI